MQTILYANGLDGGSPATIQDIINHKGLEGHEKERERERGGGEVITGSPLIFPSSPSCSLVSFVVIIKEEKR
jgi:hypothetical protein